METNKPPQDYQQNLKLHIEKDTNWGWSSRDILQRHHQKSRETKQATKEIKLIINKTILKSTRNKNNNNNNLVWRIGQMINIKNRGP